MYTWNLYVKHQCYFNKKKRKGIGKENNDSHFILEYSLNMRIDEDLK